MTLLLAALLAFLVLRAIARRHRLRGLAARPIVYQSDLRRSRWIKGGGF